MKNYGFAFFFFFHLVFAQAQAPVANFTAGQVSGCAPFVVAFQDLSSGNPTAWKWDFGNGATSTLKNPSTTYFSAGTHTVTLTVTNSNGTHTLTRTGYITVFEKPKVSFAADQVTGCFPLRIAFSDSSTAGAGTRNMSWQWDFGNGTQSNQPNPQAMYTAAGSYPVTLKVTSDKGCAATLTQPAYIQVQGGLTADFTNTGQGRCQAPFPVTFTSTASGPGTLTYLWDFGDGTTASQPAVSHTYATPGSYTVSLAVTSSQGCTDTVRKQNAVSLQQITTRFTAPDSVCVSAPAAFQNTATPAPQSATWFFGDGNSSAAMHPTHSFTSPGTYTVRLYNTYASCTDSFSKLLEVLPLPQAAFNANITLQCKPPLPVQFTDHSTGAVRWHWDFGDGQTSTDQNPVHTYTNYGDFTVALTVTNIWGCTHTSRQPAYIRIQKPVISFPSLPQTGCLPYTTAFTASVSTVDNISTYLWNFGDGSTSAAASPSHTYTSQGSYPVTLTINTSTGCTETFPLANAVVAGRQPTIGFTATPNPVCAFQPISFSGTASESDAWSWDFGDGATAAVQNPTHTYTDTGQYTVRMTVTNSGCSESLTQIGAISVAPPIARFTVQKSCSTAKGFLFTDASVGATAWHWDFGDGQTATGQNPAHAYASDGSYTVSLTVTNGSCAHTTSLPVSVFNQKAAFTANRQEACKTATIQYTATPLDPATIAAYLWDFSNGTTATAMNPAVTYSNAGNFSTTLITTDIYGCRDTAVQTDFIRINGPAALLAVTNNAGCAGLRVAFTDNSTTDGLHPITQWEWRFGDGQLQKQTNGSPVYHTYNTAGNYPVQLLVTDAAGCTDSIQINDLVRTSVPKAAFSSADTLVCLGSGVQFNNQSAAQSFTAQWDFGDGAMSNTLSPVHAYTDTGTYNVRLWIQDANGCADSLALPHFVTIKKTTAAFTPSDSVGICTPYEVHFTNTSQFYAASLWTLANTTRTTSHTVHTFLQPGLYPVSLVVTGPGGCTDTAIHNIRIYDESASQMTYTPLDGCRPVLLQASASSQANVTYTWDFGDGTLLTTNNKDTAHLYTSIGDFVPRLILSDSGNCLVPVSGTDTVRVRGSLPAFTWNDRLFCDSGTIFFRDSTLSNEAVTAWHWDFGDGATATLQHPAHRYTQPGVYTVSLRTQTASLCSDTVTIQHLVKVVQSPKIGILGNAVVCAGGWVQHSGLFLRPDTSAVQWYWQFPNGATSSAIRPPAQQYTVAGSGAVQAVAVNSSGCADTAIASLTVHPLPAISLPPTLTSRVGQPVRIQPTSYAPNVVRYEWTPAAGLSCTDCPQPLARPSFNTLYQVTVTDSNGCRNTARVEVLVFCNNVNVFVPNTFSPNGDGSNDVFYVRGSGLAHIKQLRVFNRLGEVVFERRNIAANDAGAGWDGTYKGVPLTPDTFIYQVDVFCENSETVRLEGSLTLIR